MGKKQQGEGNKEGEILLGAPTFKELENGRFKCLETSHELPAHARESYAQSKHCRLVLIDSALARNKTPLNMFQQDPLCRSKLTCKLTGLAVNKSEDHIWKHINGKRFLNALVPCVYLVNCHFTKSWSYLKQRKKKLKSKHQMEQWKVQVNRNQIKL